MKKTTKHQFALYCKDLSKKNNNVVINDLELVQRVSKILRLDVGDTVTLFDGKQAVDVSITALDKKQLTANIIFSEAVQAILPVIHCIVPVLKRDALEEVIYAAAELGATSLQLVFSEKVQRAWAGQKEFERLQNILIAACEQSKQFAVPQLYAPIAFDEVIEKLTGKVIFFDADGQLAYEIVTALHKEKPAEIIMIIGPEADLSENEKDLLRKKTVIFCKLTPTVLRARQAFAVGLGMMRSMI